MDGFSKENQSANPKILTSIESPMKLFIKVIKIDYTIIFNNFIYFYSLTMIIKGSYSFILSTNFIFIKKIKQTSLIVRLRIN